MDHNEPTEWVSDPSRMWGILSPIRGREVSGLREAMSDVLTTQTLTQSSICGSQVTTDSVTGPVGGEETAVHIEDQPFSFLLWTVILKLFYFPEDGPYRTKLMTYFLISSSSRYIN